MAIEELEVTHKSCDSNSYTFDELQDAFEELAIDFESMNLKYKKMIFKLIMENELLTNTKVDLEKKIDSMKLNFESSQKRIENLENENLILKEECEGLINEIIVLDKNVSCIKMTKCTHCNYHGHSLNACPIRRNIPYKFRQVWAPKGTRDLVTNS